MSLGKQHKSNPEYHTREWATDCESSTAACKLLSASFQRFNQLIITCRGLSSSRACEKL